MCIQGQYYSFDSIRGVIVTENKFGDDVLIVSVVCLVYLVIIFICIEVCVYIKVDQGWIRIRDIESFS